MATKYYFNKFSNVFSFRSYRFGWHLPIWDISSLQIFVQPFAEDSVEMAQLESTLMPSFTQLVRMRQISILSPFGKCSELLQNLVFRIIFESTSPSRSGPGLIPLADPFRSVRSEICDRWIEISG